MYTTKIIPALSWWSHGATFTTPMRVLDLGSYDAILGMDWLQLHSPMITDWEKKFISFPYKGQHITLHGMQPVANKALREIPVEQLSKWTKGNEVWAIAVVHPSSALEDSAVSLSPPKILSLLTEFATVFSEPTVCHRSDNTTMQLPSSLRRHRSIHDHTATLLHTRTRLSAKWKKCLMPASLFPICHLLHH
uniref:Uncharacterized protein n=1 Tax=Avena sativa TaxID=4498 RepID=A0ACD5UNF4_AVESA